DNVLAVEAPGDTDNVEALGGEPGRGSERGSKVGVGRELGLDEDLILLLVTHAIVVGAREVRDQIDIASLRWVQLPERDKQVRLPGLVRSDQRGDRIRLDPSAVSNGAEHCNLKAI